MSARREHRLRSLEKRVSKLEVQAARGYLHSNILEYLEAMKQKPVDACWARTPSAPQETEQPRRSLWKRLTDIFRKDR